MKGFATDWLASYISRLVIVSYVVYELSIAA